MNIWTWLSLARARPEQPAAPRWLWLLPVLVAGLAIAMITALHPMRAAPDILARPAPAAVLGALRDISAMAWNRVPINVVRPPVAVTPIPGTTVRGVPLVLYVGVEYCPYCAAQRWPIIAALARFGTFRGLETIRSSASEQFPRTPTFTFLHATYDSPYLVFRTVEGEGNVRDPVTGRYPTLQRLTPEELRVYRHYNPSGEVPFLLVGGRYLWLDSSFSPGLLHGLTWTAISSTVRDGHGAAGRAILATATEITAAVCATDGGRPVQVCTTPAVQRTVAALPANPAR